LLRFLSPVDIGSEGEDRPQDEVPPGSCAGMRQGNGRHRAVRSVKPHRVPRPAGNSSEFPVFNYYY
jgi:hypothetical protein